MYFIAGRSEEEELMANGGESWFTEQEENIAPDTEILATSVPACISSATPKMTSPPPTRVKVEDLVASRNKQGMFEREDSERMDPEDEVRLTLATPHRLAFLNSEVIAFYGLNCRCFTSLGLSSSLLKVEILGFLRRTEAYSLAAIYESGFRAEIRSLFFAQSRSFLLFRAQD